MGVSIRREIDNSSEEVEPDILIDVADGVFVGETPISYAPMVLSGPYNTSEGSIGTSVLAEDGQTNLLANATFELGALTSWTTNNVTAAASTELKHFKNYTAKLTSTANNTDHYIQQQVAGSSSTTYIAYVWVNMPESGVIGTGSATKGASLVVREINGSSVQVGLNETALNAHSTSGWQQLVVPFTTSGTTANIQVRLHVYDAGPVYFDSAQLIQTTANQYPTSFIDGMRGLGYSFSGTRDNSTSIRADNQIYFNTTNYNLNSSGMTALVWGRPLWDWNESAAARAYTPFAVTNDAGTGLAYQYSTSRVFEIVGNATATVVAGDTFRFTAGEQLVFGLKVDGSNNTWGYLGKQHNNVYRELVLAHGNLISYWRLGEITPTATTAGFYYDSKSTNHLDVTLGSAKYGADKTDGALNEDGNGAVKLTSLSGSSITKSFTASLNSATFSVEFWVKVDQFTTSVVRNFMRSYDASNQGYMFEFAAGGKTFNFTIGTGATTSSVASSTLEQGVWYHYVGLYNGTKQQLYENGRLKAEATVSFSAETNAIFNLLTAGSEGVISLDECAYYNTALTAQEIWEHYSAAEKYMAYKTITNGTMTANTPTRFHIGNNNAGTTWFDGYIDGALIFNKVLSDDRIKQYVKEGFSKNSEAILVLDNTVAAAEVASVSVATPSIEGTESYTLTDNNTNYKVVWNKA